MKGNNSGFLTTAIREVTKATCGRLLEGSMSWQVPLTPCTHPKYHCWLCDHDCSVIHHFNSWFSFTVLRNIFILSCVLIFCSFLFPVLWHLWIYAGSANSNFYYAITLTFNIGQVSRVRQVKLHCGQLGGLSATVNSAGWGWLSASSVVLHSSFPTLLLDSACSSSPGTLMGKSSCGI